MPRIRTVAVLASAVLYLPSGLPAAAEQAAVTVVPTHGQPEKAISVTAKIEKPYTCHVYWDDDPTLGRDFECGPTAKAGLFKSVQLAVPKTLAAGIHTITATFPNRAKPVLIGSTTFTVDPPVVTPTTSTPLTVTPPFPTFPKFPTFPTTVTSTATTTVDSSSSTMSTSSETTPTPEPAGENTGSQPGLAGVVSALVLAAAVMLPWIIRGIRLRSPRWVGRHVRFATTVKPPHVGEITFRSRPATAVRLEIRAGEPTRETNSPEEEHDR